MLIRRTISPLFYWVPFHLMRMPLFWTLVIGTPLACQAVDISLSLAGRNWDRIYGGAPDFMRRARACG